MSASALQYDPVLELARLIKISHKRPTRAREIIDTGHDDGGP